MGGELLSVAVLFPLWADCLESLIHLFEKVLKLEILPLYLSCDLPVLVCLSLESIVSLCHDFILSLPLVRLLFPVLLSATGLSPLFENSWSGKNLSLL